MGNDTNLCEQFNIAWNDPNIKDDFKYLLLLNMTLYPELNPCVVNTRSSSSLESKQWFQTKDANTEIFKIWIGSHSSREKVSVVCSFDGWAIIAHKLSKVFSSVFWIVFSDFFSDADPEPGWKKIRIRDPAWTSQIFFEVFSKSLETVFWVKNT